MYDRSLPADGPATADRETGSQRFDDRYHGTNDTLPVINCTHHLWNAVPLRLGGEVFDQKRHAQCANNRYKNDKYTPRTGGCMNVGVESRGKLAKKQQVMNETNQRAECNRPQSGYHPYQDG